MGDSADACLAGTQCSGAVGALTGLALGIWAAVEFLQPALHDVNGISKEGADWITASICIFGGLEAFAGAGYCAGVIAFPILAAATACLGMGCVGLKTCCEATAKRMQSCTPFWSRADTTSQQGAESKYSAPASSIETREPTTLSKV